MVGEPFEKLVRVTRGGPKKVKTFCVRMFFREAAVMTLGADTMEEAKRWKAAIEAAAKAPEAAEALENAEEDEAYHDARSEHVVSPKAVKSALRNRESLAPEGWRHARGDEHWHVVEPAAGPSGTIQVEGEINPSHSYPLLRARAEVNFNPAEVFAMVIDDSKRPLGVDSGVLTSKVLRTINETSAIVYMQTNSIWVGPLNTGPRDLCLLRYYRKEDDDSGEFVVTWQSVEDAVLAPVAEGFTRGKIFSMGMGVSKKSPGVSMLKIVCHADPGGPLSYAPNAVLQKWLAQFVTRLTSLQPVLDNDKKLSTRKNSLAFVGEQEDAKTFEDEQPYAATSASPSPKVGPKSAQEVNQLKLGTWNHAEWLETPSEETFKVRGKTYLTDGVKYHTGKHMFHMVAADLNLTETPIPHCAARSDSPLKDIQRAYPGRQVLIMQFVMPGPPFYLLAFYAVSKPGVLDEDTPFSRLWNDFVEGSDEYRNTVFKILPRVTKGPYLVRKTVGEVPAMLGQKVKLNYYTGPNYIEVDVDLNTSAVAGSILSIFKSATSSIAASDLALLLEGHTEDELPEQILCSFRMTRPNLGGAKKLGRDPNPEETQKLRDLAERGRKGEMKKAKQ